MGHRWPWICIQQAGALREGQAAHRAEFLAPCTKASLPAGEQGHAQAVPVSMRTLISVAEPTTATGLPKAHLVRVRSHRDAESACQPEVCQLQDVVSSIYKQVLRLEVAVQHSAG